MVAYIRFPASELPKAVGLDRADGARRSDGRPGHLCHGPYITLGPGLYTAGFYIRREAERPEGEVSIDVCNQSGQRIFAGRAIPVSVLLEGIAGLTPLDFSIETVEAGCELRLYVSADAHVELSEIVLFRRDLRGWGHR